MLSSLKPFDEIQPTHMDGFVFGSTPWGGVKKSNIIKFQLQNQFQRFLYQTLCIFSQIKDIKHIEQGFHSVAWVSP